jgi:putative peptidoglycan lipid II flippase
MSASTLRTSGRIAIGTLLSRVTGLVRVGATAAALDIGALTDVYNSANSTPNLIYELLLGGVLTATLVPLFVDLSDHDERRATGAVFGTVIAALVALSTVAIVAAPAIARLLSSQVPAADHPEAVALGTSLVRCFALQVVGYGFTALAAAALNARKRFVAAAYAPILNNVIVAAVLLAIGTSDPTLEAVDGDAGLTLALGLGTTAGVLATALALVPALRAARVPWRPRWEPRHPAVRRLFRQSGWTLGYVVANQIALLVVMIVAREDAGALSAYQFAFVFFQLPHGLVAVSIMTAWLPELVEHARQGRLDAMRARFDAGMRALVVLVVPASAGLLALSIPIVDTLLATDDTSPAATAAALTGFALGLVPFSIYLFTLRGFYALGDTRTPFLVNALENGLNIAFALVAVDRWGVRGLAGAYSAAYLVASLVATWLLRRRIGSGDRVATRRILVVSGMGGLACGVAAHATAGAFASPAAALVIGTLSGAIVYGAVTFGVARGDVLAALGRGSSAPPKSLADV